MRYEKAATKSVLDTKTFNSSLYSISLACQIIISFLYVKPSFFQSFRPRRFKKMPTRASVRIALSHIPLIVDVPSVEGSIRATPGQDEGQGKHRARHQHTKGQPSQQVAYSGTTQLTGSILRDNPANR